MTIVLDATPTTNVAPGLCLWDNASAREAYAIVGGTRREKLEVAQFLIDRAGWLRAVQMTNSAAIWDDPGALAAAIAKFDTLPLGRTEHAGMPMNMKM